VVAMHLMIFENFGSLIGKVAVSRNFCCSHPPISSSS